VFPLVSELVLEHDVTGLVVGLFEHEWVSRQYFCWTNKYV